jgi:acetoin utilization deacetylase AcuC-like enzyme
MAVFWDDPSVFFASLHGDPQHDYPFNAGFADQTGGPLALGATLNLPLPGGTDWPAYSGALAAAVEQAAAFGAEALVVSLGFDTLRGDPVAFPKARFRLEPSDGAEMGRLLLEGALCVPTVVVQEGGYALQLVPAAVSYFLTGGLRDETVFDLQQ